MKGARLDSAGFTILELVTVVAIIAILGTIALLGYQEYTLRARAADILVKYDAIRSGAGERLADLEGIDDCAQLAHSLDTANLTDPYATLAYGFEATNGGYRPVLTVCAKADATIPMNVKVAKGAHDTMAKTGSVEPGAVVTDTVVSFALPLTGNKDAVCKTAAPAPLSACGTLPAAVVQTPTQSTAIGGSGVQATGQPPNPCPPGQETVQKPSVIGSSSAVCLPFCQTGETRNADGLCMPAQQAVSTPSQAAAASGTGTSPITHPDTTSAQSPAAGSTLSAGQTSSDTHQQCINHCKQTICQNCNSRAYRNCVAGCTP